MKLRKIKSWLTGVLFHKAGEVFWSDQENKNKITCVDRGRQNRCGPLIIIIHKEFGPSENRLKERLGLVCRRNGHNYFISRSLSRLL